MPNSLRYCLCVKAITSVILFASLCAPAFATQPRLLKGKIEGRDVEALELVKVPGRHVLLANDGWLFDLHPDHTANKLVPVEGKFQPLTAMELKNQLYTEFGNKYEVVATQHFLVVQPRNSGRSWPDRFEQLHRTFLTYFSVRGVRLLEGNFPMVAIVYPSREEFEKTVDPRNPNRSKILGLYDRFTNRISMYDHGGSASGIDATLCHEAAHQSAFNVGVHSRVSDTPHWMVEGIGCLFQSPALVEGRRTGDLQGRCDPQLLWLFREEYGDDPDKLADDISQIVAENQLFRHPDSVDRAYVVAWAIAFYLSEKRPSDFANLVETYAQRPPFENYERHQRVQDFQRVIGPDMNVLGRQITRFLEQF